MDTILIDRAKRVFYRRLRQWGFYRNDWTEEQRAQCIFAIWRFAFDLEAAGEGAYVKQHLDALPKRLQDDLVIRLVCVNAARDRQRREAV